VAKQNRGGKARRPHHKRRKLTPKQLAQWRAEAIAIPVNSLFLFAAGFLAGSFYKSNKQKDWWMF
jgi:hypothetical protein